MERHYQNFVRKYNAIHILNMFNLICQRGGFYNTIYLHRIHALINTVLNVCWEWINWCAIPFDWNQHEHTMRLRKLSIHIKHNIRFDECVLYILYMCTIVCESFRQFSVSPVLCFQFTRCFQFMFDVSCFCYWFNT